MLERTPSAEPDRSGAGRALTRVLIDGLMVVAPVGAIVLLVIAIWQRLSDAAEPLAGRFLHPALVGAILLLLLCLVIGVLVRSVVGRWVQQSLESALFEKIPGYRLAKAFVGEGPMAKQGQRPIRPALARIEEGLCPALVMDEFADGRLVVFVPGAPAPVSGAIYLFTPDKVIFVDAPPLIFLRSIASWGLGLREVVEGAGATTPVAGAAATLPASEPLR